MKDLVLPLPDNIDLDANYTKRFLAAKLFEVGKLSLGQSSDMAGLSKSAFMEILKDFDVSVINYNPQDVINDSLKI